MSHYSTVLLLMQILLTEATSSAYILYVTSSPGTLKNGPDGIIFPSTTVLIFTASNLYC